MKFINALDLKQREMICLVGAGGKTSIMYQLAKELSGTGARVLVTTTTKMFDWQLKSCCNEVLIDNEESLLVKIKQYRSQTNLLAVCSGVFGEKIRGLSKEALDEIYSLQLFDYILVEADGSRGKSLKAPADHEPVLPTLTTTVLAVAGVDILGYPLNEETVHRPHLVNQITSEHLGQPVSVTTLIKVLRHYERVVKKSVPSLNWVPIFNKVDTPEDKQNARNVARKLLSSSTQKVLLTSALVSDPVLEVVP
ncbi:uncharacterized MobA-related protein-like protein [Desulforamulus reducens MI-1]|uniref:Uncharacterized MobA-related protein-like protein n=1 Tax=Desulforamulus reducens (strain ATCC BAA-1160 / DSM 100696 / MI-1) TaxID=349161 RepID=A4J863_DESRM|nr:selenium cofactor biosynthesis protein YqeC [Desulforamulus reducens]ABO51266.1 uncharacterized MobA-related protein-like protein [Desulforamulus reducens MI-1]